MIENYSRKKVLKETMDVNNDGFATFAQIELVIDVISTQSDV